MSFALLLRLQLVVKLLLEFLFGEVHFTNGSVVFYPPLASWRKDVQFSKCLCDIWVSPAFNAGLAGYPDKKAQKLRNDGCYGLCSALYWLRWLSQSRAEKIESFRK